MVVEEIQDHSVEVPEVPEAVVDPLAEVAVEGQGQDQPPGQGQHPVASSEDCELAPVNQHTTIAMREAKELINQKEGNGNIDTDFAHSEQVCEFTSENFSSFDQLADQDGLSQWVMGSKE